MTNPRIRVTVVVEYTAPEADATVDRERSDYINGEFEIIGHGDDFPDLDIVSVTFEEAGERRPIVCGFLAEWSGGTWIVVDDGGGTHGTGPTFFDALCDWYEAAQEFLEDVEAHEPMDPRVAKRQEALAQAVNLVASPPADLDKIADKIADRGGES